jgi:hypothetical protein
VRAAAGRPVGSPVDGTDAGCRVGLSLRSKDGFV